MKKDDMFEFVKPNSTGFIKMNIPNKETKNEIDIKKDIFNLCAFIGINILIDLSEHMLRYVITERWARSLYLSILAYLIYKNLKKGVIK